MTEPIPSAKSIMEKIKSLGHWKVIVRPLKFKEKRLSSLSICKQIVEESQVRMRGWSYPNINRTYGIRSGKVWIENATDSPPNIEFWRMYQSGQFYYLFSCREDWWRKTRIFWSDKPNIEPGYGLSFLSTLYTFTEIYEFIHRLAKKGVFDDSLRLSLVLLGMLKRRIVTLDVTRSLNSSYICSIDKIPISRTLAVSDLMEKRNEFAVDDTISVFERFNWFNPPRKVLTEVQDKFLKGLI